MAKYRKADNCGRVPHPDRSGKFLHEGEVVEGDEWESLVALGYVVRIDSGAAQAPAKIEEPKAAILKEDPQGVSDVVQQANVGSGAEEGTGAGELDVPDAGLSDAGRVPRKRR